MKKPDAQIFDDLARMAGGALNVFSGLREQILSEVKVRVDEAASRMDLVPREDFDRLQMRVDELQSRLDALSGEKKSTEPKAAAKKAAPKKTASKKSAKKTGKK